mgnify:CR=1 FL=1
MIGIILLNEWTETTTAAAATAATTTTTTADIEFDISFWTIDQFIWAFIIYCLFGVYVWYNQESILKICRCRHRQQKRPMIKIQTIDNDDGIMNKVDDHQHHHHQD